VSREFNSVVAHVGQAAIPGRIEALEGGRGMLRVLLESGADGPELSSSELGEGSEWVLEMHDGARFRVTVTERLEDPNQLRLKLLGRG